jgi:VWFA-related protein
MLFGMSRTRCFGRSLLMLAIPALLLAGTMLCGMPLCGMPLCAQSQPGANGADAKSMTSAATSATVAHEISLTVVVRDKQGEAVDGLTAEDFAIESDGRAERVTAVVREVDSPLLVGLVANTSRGQRKALADERRAAAEFVKSLREGRDRAFVIRFSREVELLQDVTTSRERLLKGVDAISVGEQHSAVGERRRGEESTDDFLFAGNTLYDAIFLACGDVMKTRKGRKALVVFSNGVDYESRTKLQEAIRSAQRGNVVVYTVYVPEEPEEDHLTRMPSGAGLGGGAHDTSHDGESSRESRNKGRQVLERIARETGGRYFEIKKKELNKKEMNTQEMAKNSALTEIYREIAGDMRQQYTLRFTVEGEDLGYHRMKVTVKKRGVTAQAAEGYFVE